MILWYIDSGAFNHMVFDQNMFNTSRRLYYSPIISTANGSTMTAKSIGSVSVSRKLSVPDVLLVPELSMNLLSVGQLCDQGHSVTFFSNGCFVKDISTGKLVGTGRRSGRLFVLDNLQLLDKSKSNNSEESVSCSEESACFSSGLQNNFVVCFSEKLSSFSLWHRRLGHVSCSKLKYLVSTSKLGPIKSDDLKCISCKLAKSTILPFNKSESVSLFPFDLVHSDVWGPSRISTVSGIRYYVIFVDDYSRFTWIYLLKKRSELFEIYQEFATMVRTQFSKVIKRFRADSGGEYQSTQLKEFLKSQGTLAETSCVDTPQQNGVAERKHRHILETSRAMLLSSSVPKQFWGEAVLTSVYLINRIPSSVIGGISPFERLYKSVPNYSDLRVFGSTCFVHLPKIKQDKLNQKSAICVFFGTLRKLIYYCY
jgi:hypothetical protein